MDTVLTMHFSKLVIDHRENSVAWPDTEVYFMEINIVARLRYLNKQWKLSKFNFVLPQVSGLTINLSK